jgi:ABC-2 type transport system ATP-binding protein
VHSRVNILEIDGLTKAYPGGQPVLRGVSLSVAEGSVTGFIGLNGAGKTTTIRIIAGLLSADAGTVRVFGHNVHPADPEYKRSLGFVLDEPLYFDWMEPDEYLRFVGLMYGLNTRDAGHRADELLDFFDLADKRGELIGTLSTGMKKKISLGAAVIHRPRMLILDEPFEGIDALAATAVKDALMMMVERGMTVMITSHVLATIEKLCTHIAVIHHGKIILQGRTAEVKRDTLNRSQRDAQEQSLEELFIDLVSQRSRKKPLSYF